ncbi:cell division protein FtsX [Varunaivibrio sulfuroxidans]|uniref:Cell division transport system permease protein n=1 Tax=Varunaivibrio sulfuroxidans TaxID=1773489 RepID=A0A4V2UP28_9PROT|nr:cell division protein [Varunaivibrio sulfuroxidans]TCS63521.1 cell division transport system permease protein [Varunaivibrio sulfuroxidans]WES30334.1 cell division protein [Varunaivibrio sulfuroxidans]
MFQGRSDLPLDRDALSRFLPWLIAFMVFLAALALAGMLALSTMTARWNANMNATLTVQIPPGADDAATLRRTEQALRLIRQQPGIVQAHEIPERDVLTLLKPWLGAAVVGDLPLPVLIDVTLDRQGNFNGDVLTRRLTIAVPGAVVDDHRIWLDRLIRLVGSVKILAWVVLGLIASATTGTVIFATRTGLSIHQEAIEVLHLTGARDSYVAKQFARRAMALGFRGGMIGLLLAALTIGGIGRLASSLQSEMVPDLSLGVGQWLSLAALPVAVAGLAMITARLTVMRNLSKML